MQYITSLLVLIFLFSGCDSTKKTQSSSTNDTFEVLYKSEYGGKEDKSFEIIRTKTDLNEQLLGVPLDEAALQRVQNVDFSKYSVLALHSGLKNTGGYSIGISKVEKNGSTTYVTVQEISPAKGDMVTMALTNPFCIVLIDRNETIIFK